MIIFHVYFFYLGMASWKRVIDQWDESYSFLDDAFNMKQLSDIIKQRSYRKDFISTCQFHKRIIKLIMNPFLELVCCLIQV